MFNLDFPQWPGTAISIGVLLGWVGNLLPAAATLASLAYFLLQIYRDPTFKHWNNNRIQRHQARLLLRWQAKEKIAQAKITAIELIRHHRADAKDLIAVAKADAASLVVAQTAEPDTLPIP